METNMDYQVYCAICGAPVVGGKLGDREHTEWLRNAVLLTSTRMTKNGLELNKYSPHRLLPSLSWSYLDLDEGQSDKDQLIVRLDAVTPDWTTEFLLTETGEEVTAYRYDNCDIFNPSKTGHRLFIPVHKGCLEIADHFMAWATNHTSQSSPGSITTVNDLWKTLYLRINENIKGLYQCPDEPHCYFGGRLCRGRTWEVAGDDQWGYIKEKDPVAIQGLTEQILQHLEPLPASIMKDSIRDSLTHASNDNNMRTHQNLQTAEPDILTIPWLWDLDTTLVYAKQAEGNWDWARLVRGLIHTFQTLDDEAVKLSQSLRNRCRIWRLLKEARMGDVNEQRRARAIVVEGRNAERRAAAANTGPQILQYPPGRCPPGFGTV